MAVTTLVAGSAGAQGLRRANVPIPTGSPVIALVGGTVIDGKGGAPLRDATVVIAGDRIVRIGPSAKTPVPANAWRIDAHGKYLTPGFVDANVHVSAYTGGAFMLSIAGVENSAFGHVQIALNAAHELLRHGVTTARDTWGVLAPLLAARDSLAHGGAVGARLLVAGNIIGLGDDSDPDLTRGMGHDIVRLSTDSLRAVTGRYLDTGVDFIKIAVTDHDAGQRPEPLLFSTDQLAAMVGEAHRRGKRVDSHTATPEAVRLAALAGVDVLQHPELTHGRPIPDDVIHLLAERHTVCSLMVGQYTGHEFFPGDTGQELVIGRANAQALIRGGCTVAVATDASQFVSMKNWQWGDQTLWAIEELVTLGMTPAQALVAATRNGAIASGAEREYGTLEAGKYADIVVLGADPLADIHNIEKTELVLHRGYVIDRSGKQLHRETPP